MPRATKIVATLGPASSSSEVLDRMIRAGVDVVRMNFSHGKAQDHIDRATLVREVARRAVREVEAHHVDAGAHHPLEHLRGARRRPEGGDDLGGAGGMGVHQLPSRARRSRISIAGRILPSRTSRKAPPPVEM